MSRDPSLRASDADRDQVVDVLRDAMGAGRLTDEEFRERLDAAYAARTYGDLDPLVADLPRGPETVGLPVPVEARHEPGRHHGRPAVAHSTSSLQQQVRAWVTASVICWAIWLAALLSGSGLQGLWPVWVSVPWGGVIAARALTDRR